MLTGLYYSHKANLGAFGLDMNYLRTVYARLLPMEAM